MCGGLRPPHIDFVFNDRCRAQLVKECYPRGNCVASELGKEQTVGQIKICQPCFILDFIAKKTLSLG